VIAEALKLLFRKDDEFKRWADQYTNNHNNEKAKGDVLETMLAEMGEHQLTIRDYLRHSNLHVTNKYLQATPESNRLAQGKLVDAILPSGLLSVNKSTLIQ